MAIRVYEYGCGRGQIMGLEAALDQMQRRVDFWNRLVEIDNDVRARMDALLFAGECESELSSLRERLKNLLQGGSVASAAEHISSDGQKSAEVGVLRVAIRTKLEEVKKIRKVNAAVHREQLRELDAERKARIAQVQSSAGLYWANRDDIRRKYEVARLRAIRAGRTLRPQIWDGGGKTTVQFQKSLLVPQAFAQNGRLQINPVPDAAWLSHSRAERRRLDRTRVRIRVAAREDRSPIWLDVPLVLHRPLPQAGVIRSASFIREHIGTSWRHRVLFTVLEPNPNPTENNNAVGIDFGWRVVPRGLRVAYWAGQDGRSGELVLPPADLTEFKKIGGLEATIRASREAVVSTLRQWMDGRTVPDEWAKTAEKALSASSPAGMVQLFECWQACRFRGDHRAFGVLRDWHKRYLHLWTWQANLRDQLLRRRRELYRRFAADLAHRYGRVFVNDIPLGRLALRPRSGDMFIPAARHHRFIAAVSTLCRILQHACEKRGVLWTRVKCRGATKSCHVCGTLDDWNPQVALAHTCSKCGQSWDQDHNAAMHVLREGVKLASSAQENKV